MLFGSAAKTAFSFFAALLITGALSMSPASAQGRDFKDKDLKGASFRGQALDGADFSGATLVSADFYGASLRGAKFDGAEVTNAIFTRANLAGADMRNTFGRFIVTYDTDFSQVNMEGLDLKGTNFYGANFRGANLRKTAGWGSCSNCSFRAADLRGANLMSMPQGGREGMFFGAIYDDATIWPRWVDVARSGAKKAQ